MPPITAVIAQRPMTPDEVTFFHAVGSRIARFRKDADLTQVQLADALGIAQQQLASYEVGRRRVPVSLLPRLARALDVSIEDIIGEDEGRSAGGKRGPASALQQQGAESATAACTAALPHRADRDHAPTGRQSASGISSRQLIRCPSLADFLAILGFRLQYADHVYNRIYEKIQASWHLGQTKTATRQQSRQLSLCKDMPLRRCFL